MDEMEAKGSKDGDKATKEKKQIEKLSSALTDHVVRSLLLHSCPNHEELTI